jgi:hypothetical protein
MFTQEDKDIARALMANEKFVELIAKVFLDTEDKLSLDMLSRNDDELGQLVRADMMAEVKVKTRFGKLKQLASDPTGKAKPAAKA